MGKEKPDFNEIKAKFERERERFGIFSELLLFYNQRFNLTAITEKEEVIHKHFLDSLAAVSFLPERAKCVEVGSGAGFPSVPLMIVRNDLSFVLIESTGKKCEFLRTAVRELSLPAEVVCARAEDVGRGELRETADVCVARAVAKLNTLAEYCLPLVKQQGTFIAYKGEADEEVEEAATAIEVLGGDRAEIFHYDLPDGYGSRSLVLIPKKRPTPPRYPRGQGAERRSPIR